MTFDLNETLSVSTNKSLDQKQQLDVKETKSKYITPSLIENLASLNVETTNLQEKEREFTSKEKHKNKAKTNLESLTKQLNIELVNPLESIDTFKREKYKDEKIEKQFIKETTILQTTEIVPNSRETHFKTSPLEEAKSQIDLVESQAFCTSVTHFNDKEQVLKKLESKSEKINLDYEKNSILNIQENLILQTDDKLKKGKTPKENKADLSLQASKAFQSLEVVTNEKEDRKDFKRKVKTRHLTPLISTKEAVIVKQVDYKDSSIDFEKLKLEEEKIAPTIDSLEALEISKPNSIENLRKQKKTVTIKEQADFSLLENISLEVGLCKSASTVEQFILEKKDLSTVGELNLADKKAIQESKSLVLEKENKLKIEKNQLSNATKELLADNAVIVNLNEKIDSTQSFDTKRTKISKAKRDLSESKLKLVEIKDLQVNGEAESFKEHLNKEKANLNLNEKLSLQVFDTIQLEKELELKMPKYKRKSIKDKKILLKSRSLSCERKLVFDKEEVIDFPKVFLAQAQHELIPSNLIAQQQRDLLQSVENLKIKKLKPKKASISLNNLCSLQIDFTNLNEIEKELNLKPTESTKILPLSICGLLNSADSQTIFTDYKTQKSGKFFLHFLCKSRRRRLVFLLTF